MTAFSGIYSSMTGLFGFSTALDVVSDNISNLNTPGFKSNESLFRDLGSATGGTADQSFEQAIGQGTYVSGQVRNFAEGQIQATGNPDNLAIDGSGFFVETLNGQQLYTRAGQFKFDTDGHLVDSVTGARVQAIDSSGKLSDLMVDQIQTSHAVPTTQVKFSGTLSTGQTDASNNPTFTLNSIKVVDASGTSQTLTATFTLDKSNTTAGTTIWDVTVTDANGETLTTGQQNQIRFDGTQEAQPGFDTLDIILPTANQQSSFVTLDFSDAISNSSGTTSTLAVESADGTPEGALTGITFDTNGIVQLAFSNGKTETGPQVALAAFSNPAALVESGNSTFAIPRGSDLTPTLGHSGDDGFGTLQAGSLELANVDLGQEFANIIVLQRGYQGSSQVLNVASQMLDTLYNALSNR